MVLATRPSGLKNFRPSRPSAPSRSLGVFCCAYLLGFLIVTVGFTVSGCQPTQQAAATVIGAPKPAEVQSGIDRLDRAEAKAKADAVAATQPGADPVLVAKVLQDDQTELRDALANLEGIQGRVDSALNVARAGIGAVGAATAPVTSGISVPVAAGSSGLISLIFGTGVYALMKSRLGKSQNLASDLADTIAGVAETIRNLRVVNTANPAHVAVLNTHLEKVGEELTVTPAGAPT